MYSKTFILCLSIVLGAVIVTILTHYLEKKSNINQKDKNKEIVKIIKDIDITSRYSCLARYISYLTNVDFENVVDILIKIDKVLIENKIIDKNFLFYSIAFVESKFNIKAKTKVAYGLFQINYQANKNILKDIVKDKKDLYDVTINTKCAIRIIEDIKKHYHTKKITKILNVYSGDKTGKYAIKVLSFAKKIKYVFGVNNDMIKPIYVFKYCNNK